MNLLSPFRCLVGLCFALLLASPVRAQFGYVAQAPAPGAGLMGAGMAADPYFATGGAASTYAAPGYTPGAMTTAGTSMLTYGQLEGRYVYTTFQDSKIDSSSGLGLSLTAQLFSPFFLRADFSWSSTSGDPLSGSKGYDFNTIAIGGGGYFALADRVHLVAELGGLYSNFSASKESLSFTDGAIYVNPRLRFAASDQLELDLGIMLTSADNYNSSVVQLGGYFRMFSSMDIGAGVDFGDVQDAYHLGVRFRW